MGASEDVGADTRVTFLGALKDAALVALVTFGLSFPIVALKTEQDLQNRLMLVERWGLVVTLCAIAFVLNSLGHSRALTSSCRSSSHCERHRRSRNSGICSHG